MTYNQRIKITLLILGDSLFFYAALLAGLLSRYADRLEWRTIQQHLIPFTLVFTIWLFLFGAFGLYDLRFLKNSKLFLYRLLRVMVTNTIAAIIIFYLLPSLTIEPRRNLFIIVAVTTFSIFGWRYIFNLLIIRAPSSQLIFFGTNKETIELTDFLINNPQLGQKPVGYILNDGESISIMSLPSFNLTTKKLVHILQETGADTIIIPRDIKENKLLTKIIFQVIPRGVTVIEFTKLHEMVTGKIPLSLIGELWFIENLIGIKRGMYEFFKRLIDIILAALLTIALLFLLPIIAFVIKLESEGPIFFRQKRVGRHGRNFQLLKFRSMIKNAEELGGFKSDGQDPRHTKTGGFLRKSYLDELPQIVNILKGEMSFVGPRPERPEFIEYLGQRTPFYEMRLLVPPGLTGWAQINMENDASVEDASEKMQYDLYYIKNRSFMLDFLIILKTISAILRRQGR